jgi:hypothetical protein
LRAEVHSFRAQTAAFERAERQEEELRHVLKSVKADLRRFSQVAATGTPRQPQSCPSLQAVAAADPLQPPLSSRRPPLPTPQTAVLGTPRMAIVMQQRPATPRGASTPRNCVMAGGASTPQRGSMTPRGNTPQRCASPRCATPKRGGEPSGISACSSAAVCSMTTELPIAKTRASSTRRQTTPQRNASTERVHRALPVGGGNVSNLHGSDTKDGKGDVEICTAAQVSPREHLSSESLAQRATPLSVCANRAVSRRSPLMSIPTPARALASVVR